MLMLKTEFLGRSWCLILCEKCINLDLEEAALKGV